MLTRVTMRYKEVYCTQDVIDSINEYIEEQSSDKAALMIGKIGDNYVKEEIAPEAVQQRKMYYEGIREFLVSKCTISPVVLETSEGQFSGPEVKKILGPISTSSTFAARKLDALLVSEDAMLRALARNEWSVSSAWTQTLLGELKLTKIISDDEYCDCILKLVSLNYKFVSINSDAIIWILSKRSYKFEDDVKRIFEFFHGPTCSIESAAFVLSDVIKRVWLENLLYETKLLILDQVLVAICHGRPLKESTNVLLLMIRSRFNLMPDACSAIERYVASWKQRQLSKVGLLS